MSVPVVISSDSNLSPDIRCQEMKFNVNCICSRQTNKRRLLLHIFIFIIYDVCTSHRVRRVTLRLHPALVVLRVQFLASDDVSIGTRTSSLMRNTILSRARRLFSIYIYLDRGITGIQVVCCYNAHGGRTAPYTCIGVPFQFFIRVCKHFMRPIPTPLPGQL